MLSLTGKVVKNLKCGRTKSERNYFVNDKELQSRKNVFDHVLHYLVLSIVAYHVFIQGWCGYLWSEYSMCISSDIWRCYHSG